MTIMSFFINHPSRFTLTVVDFAASAVRCVSSLLTAQLTAGVGVLEAAFSDRDGCVGSSGPRRESDVLFLSFYRLFQVSFLGFSMQLR